MGRIKQYVISLIVVSLMLAPGLSAVTQAGGIHFEGANLGYQQDSDDLYQKPMPAFKLSFSFGGSKKYKAVKKLNNVPTANLTGTEIGAAVLLIGVGAIITIKATDDDDPPPPVPSTPPPAMER